MANTKEPVARVIGPIARPGFAVRNDEPNKVSKFEVVSSYNWLDEKNPTILVPGVNPLYSSRFGAREVAKARPFQVYPQSGVHQPLPLL